MAEKPIADKAKRAVLKCRIIAWLFPLGSLAALLGGASMVAQLTAAEFLARLLSPRILFLLGLLALIYVPASLRIYYILLLRAKGVFTAAQRQEYRKCKEKWDRHLLKAALAAAILLVFLGLLVRLGTI